jgi:hypothetical protein
MESKTPIDVKMDKYGGVVVEDMSLLATTEEAFRTQLEASLAFWKENYVQTAKVPFDEYCG